MKKKIAILGSTGSIGKSLVDIIKKDKINKWYSECIRKISKRFYFYKKIR